MKRSSRRCLDQIVFAAAISMLAGFAGGVAPVAARGAAPLAVAPAAWIPFQATPSAGTAGGKTGLFVIRSDTTQAVPSAHFLNDRAVNNYLTASTLTTGYGTSAQSDALGVILYSGIGSDGKQHLYGANLGNTSETPSERQVGSLAVAPSDVICLVGAAQTKLADPTTLLAVVDVAEKTGCFSGGSDELLLIHYADTATTAPTHVPLQPTYPLDLMTALYDSQGSLGGVLYLDGSDHQLKYFAHGEFTQPKTIANAVGDYDARLARASAVSTPVVIEFLSAPSALFSIAPSGSATERFKLSGSDSFALDAANIYSLSHSPTGTSGVKYVLSQQALNGNGASLELFAGVCSRGFDVICGYGDILYSDGKSVVFRYTNGATTAINNEILSVPAGKKDGPVTVVVSESFYIDVGSRFSVYLASPTRTPANALMYLSTDDQGPGGSGVQSTQTLTAAGAIRDTASGARYPYGGAVSNYIGLSPSFLDAPDTLMLSGLPATLGSDAGASFEAVNTATLATRSLTTPDLKTYVVPAGYRLASAVAILNGSLGSGALVCAADTTPCPARGALFDLQRGVIIPVTLHNTDVVPMNGGIAVPAVN